MMRVVIAIRIVTRIVIRLLWRGADSVVVGVGGGGGVGREWFVLRFSVRVFLSATVSSISNVCVCGYTTAITSIGRLYYYLCALREMASW